MAIIIPIVIKTRLVISTAGRDILKRQQIMMKMSAKNAKYANNKYTKELLRYSRCSRLKPFLQIRHGLSVSAVVEQRSEAICVDLPLDRFE